MRAHAPCPPDPRHPSVHHETTAGATPWVLFLRLPVLCLAIVLKGDFGEKEHCFSPIRRWVAQQQVRMWAPSATEQMQLTKIEEQLQLGDASVGK